MKPKVGLKSIELMWKDCSTAFPNGIKPFSSGGGSYQDFGFPTLHHVQKHFYIGKYCFMTIKYVRRAKYE